MQNSNIVELSPQSTKSGYNGSATVIGLVKKDIYRLRLTEDGDGIDALARLAIPSTTNLHAGDEVLVTGNSLKKLYVIGLFSTRDTAERVKASDGSYAIVKNSPESSLLQLFSKKNELLVEYDPESGKTKINIEQGDLEFSTQSGDIVFNSAKNIHVKGQTINMLAHSRLLMGVSNNLGELISSLSLRHKKAMLSSAQVGITAQQAEFQLKETRYAGEKFSGKVGDSQLITDMLTVVANSITEKAKNVYRSVEQLTQLKAGRMRTLIEETIHTKSKKTFIKTEEDFKVKSNKIHLG